MSILTSLQRVALELNLPDFTSVIGNTDKTVRQLLYLANRAGKRLRDECDWPELTKEYTFTTVDGQANYSFPSDFDSHKFQTHWDRTNHWDLIGPVTAEYWQWRKSGITAVTPRREFRVKGFADKQFFISPTPDSSSAGHTLVFEYQSKTWCRPRTWAQSQVYAVGTYTFYDGNIYFTASGGATGATPPTHTSGTSSDGGVSWAYYSTGYEVFVADTDEIILDEDLLELGVKWRFMHTKGLQYAEFKQEYEEAIKQHAAKLRSADAINLSGKRRPFLISSASVPDTGFGV